MLLSLMYEGRCLGTVDFAAPDPTTGLHHGRLAPTAAYMSARADLQLPIQQMTAHPDASHEEVRHHLRDAFDALTSRGLSLCDGETPVSTTFLMVVDCFPLEADLEVLAMAGISVTTVLASASQ